MTKGKVSAPYRNGDFTFESTNQFCRLSELVSGQLFLFSNELYEKLDDHIGNCAILWPVWGGESGDYAYFIEDVIVETVISKYEN